MRNVAVTLTCLVAISSAATAQTNGAKIAYERCHPDLASFTLTCTIHVLDGSSEIAVASGELPSWSPDGLRIVFDDSGDLYVADLAQQSVLNVTMSSEVFEHSPRWSPDGSSVAFIRDGDGLYVMDAAGMHPTRITNGIAYVAAFAWAPTSRAIAFTAFVNGVTELYAMLPDGSNVVHLTTINEGFPRSFSWSPDGARVLFDCALQVCAVNTDGSGLVQLTNDPAGASSGVLSPTGGRLAVVIGGELVVMNSDGTLVRVAPSIGASKPLWSPDGNYLSFEGTTPVSYEGRCYPPGPHNADDFCVPMYAIYVASADGSGFQAITTGADPDWFMPQPGQPIARFTHQCAGAACTFDATGSSDPEGIPLAYEWHFSDGTTASEPVTSHTFSPGGLYAVTLTVTDATGKSSTARENVSANAPPVASFAIMCSGPTCTLDGSASADADGTIGSYFWQFGDGISVGGNASARIVTHTYPTGTFSPTLTVRDNADATAQQTQSLAVTNARPVASFTVSCVQYTCAYDASRSYDVDGTIDFSWQFGDGNSWNFASAVITHSYAVAGSYTITLTVTDNARQTATSTQTVTISPQFVHIGDLDASATIQKNTWSPVVSLIAHDGQHAPVANAVVSGVWSDGNTFSCTTDVNGRCALSRVALPRRTMSITLTVTAMQRTMFTFVPADNHDPDGDSDGTTLTVSRP